MSSKKLKPRERLIETASKLFYERGFINVGINEVFKEAEVSRGTLYYNFDSKNELIRAVLKLRIGRKLNELKRVEKEFSDPKMRLKKAVEMHFEWMHESAYRGCSLLNSVIEFGNQSDKINDLTLELKEEVRVYLEKLIREARIENPKEVSHQLMIVIDGATVTSLFRNSDLVVEHSKAVLRKTLPTINF